MRSSSIHRLLIVFSALVPLSIGSCGSSDKSCSDACKALFACADKLGAAPRDFLGSYYESESSCVDRCNSGDCAGKQLLLNCVDGLQCNSLTQAKNDVTACFAKSNCSP